MRHLIAALVIALASPALAQPADPLVREGATQKISEHVYVIPDFSTPLTPNVGIIVGSKATLVVDTGLGPRNGETILREVAKVSKNRELYLVTTHVHPEHDLGASAFTGAKLIRSADQVKDIAEFGLTTARQFSQRSPMTAELLKDAQYRKADIVFEREHLLDLGGVKVRLIAMGPNHTRGDTAMFVEPDEVLFSGDVAMSALPAFASPYSKVSQWLASLDRFEAMKPMRIVPSHGPLGDLSFVSGYRAFLKTVQARAGELKTQGKGVDETVATLQGELQGRYPDRNRMGGAIRAAYAEAK
ncbi:MAG: MBL fold metallo-hydrolase [Caulobacteraceae bacterium]